MSRFLLFFLFLSLLLPSPSKCSSPIVGSWHFKNEQLEVVAEFLPGGTFRQVNISPKGKEIYAGRYQVS
jgi:hypothetical protein